jgi:HlyD family secretion protein
MRGIWIWAVVALLAVAVVLGVRGRSRHTDTGAAYESVKVDRGRVVARVTATGALSARTTVQVSSQVSGRISLLGVDYNSPVKKGMVLARLDPRPFEVSLAQARAGVTSARGALAQARAKAADAVRQRDRAKLLVARGLGAQADLDTAQASSEVADAAILSAQGNLEQAQANLDQAQVNLDYTTIRSPIDGVVLSRAIDVGQSVAASLAAPTLFTLAEDLSKMQVDTSVAEADVGKLKEGMKVSFTVDAFSGQRFTGLLRQIRNAATTVSNVVTYDAVVDCENPEGLLRPGMTATVTFVWADVPDTLRVPNAALRFRPPPEWTAAAAPAPAADGGTSGDRPHRRRPDANAPRAVWVLRGDKPEAVTVKLGLTDGSFTELKEGELAEGDVLVTELVTDGRAPGAGQPGQAGANPFKRMF